MKPEKFSEAKWLKEVKSDKEFWSYRNAYLNRHPLFLKFDFPKYFYFRILDDRCAIHWAIIREENQNFAVYFINADGRAFDRLEFKSKKQAQIALRRNKFYFSTNKKCPYLPISPVYVDLAKGRKSAPYSHPKGNLWDFDRKCEAYFDEFIKSYKPETNQMTLMYLYMDKYPQMVPKRLQKKFIHLKKQIKSCNSEILQIPKENKFRKYVNNFFKMFWKILGIIIVIFIIFVSCPPK